MLAVGNLDPARAPLVLPLHFTVAGAELLMHLARPNPVRPHLEAAAEVRLAVTGPSWTCSGTTVGSWTSARSTDRGRWLLAGRLTRGFPRAELAFVSVSDVPPGTLAVAWRTETRPPLASAFAGMAVAAYVVSFLTILIFWVNHHALYHAVDRVSRAILFVNGLLLLAISFISYSTAVVGHALQDGSNDKSAAALYAVTLGLASLCCTGLWACLLARPALLTSAARPRRIPAFRRSLTGPAAYTAAALLASVSAPASLALDFAVALYFAAPLPRHLRRAPAGHGEVRS